MFNVQCSLTRRMTIWSFMKLTFEPERIWILTLIILKSPLVIRRMSGLCLTKSNRGATTSWILENIFIGSDFIITHYARLSRNDILAVTRIEIRNEYFVDSYDIFRSVNVTLRFLLCQMIFYHRERRLLSSRHTFTNGNHNKCVCHKIGSFCVLFPCSVCVFL